MSKLDKLQTSLKGVKNLEIIIAQVDPDAVASALGLSYLVQELTKVKTQIFYCGEISHPQNRCLTNKYDLKRKMKPIQEANINLESNIALVDSFKIKDGRFPSQIQLPVPLIIIDHHRGEIDAPKKDSNQFFWIEDTGSASTMIIELLQELGTTSENFFKSEGGNMLATMLTLGIYTDTKKLVSSSQRDRKAYGYVIQFVSESEISQLIDYPLSETYFENLERALNHFIRKGSRIIAKVGTVAINNGDHLAAIADEFIRMKGITLVIVWGIIEQKVRISARSKDLSIPLDEFLKEKFGESSGAKLAPGGRSEGGSIIDLDLGFWFSEATKKEIEALVTIRLKEKVFSDLPETTETVEKNTKDKK